MTFPTPLLQTRQLGSLRIHAIQAGGQRLDGGAMFGVVPKVLWQRKIEADDRNRIQMGMRTLLIEHPDGLVLIDTGAGNKEDRKFIDIYGMELQADVPAWSVWGQQLVTLSRLLGVVPVPHADQRTPVHQFAGFIRGARRAIFPQHQYFGIGNGFAD